MNNNDVLGAIHDNNKSDYLFRLSLKSLIVNDDGSILVVKESGRDWWDLPGGGMEHGETIKDALTRELHEEVALKGDFEYEVILAENPQLLRRVNVWQMRITFVVKPKDMTFTPGDDGDEIAFMRPEYFQRSDISTEQKIYEYWQMAKKRQLYL
jgi:ADP-ribose pyrophosphatase YjhB (NUDIX family)